jgi:hypothetical protein
VNVFVNCFSWHSPLAARYPKIDTRTRKTKQNNRVNFVKHDPRASGGFDVTVLAIFCLFIRLEAAPHPVVTGPLPLDPAIDGAIVSELLAYPVPLSRFTAHIAATRAADKLPRIAVRGGDTIGPNIGRMRYEEGRRQQQQQHRADKNTPGSRKFFDNHFIRLSPIEKAISTY